jgi:hypothetical protein
MVRSTILFVHFIYLIDILSWSLFSCEISFRLTYYFFLRRSSIGARTFCFQIKSKTIFFPNMDYIQFCCLMMVILQIMIRFWLSLIQLYSRQIINIIVFKEILRKMIFINPWQNVCFFICSLWFWWYFY